MFGTFEKWTCQALSKYLNTKNTHSEEEKDHAKIWEFAKTELLPIKTRLGLETQNGEWDPLDNLPSPYLNPPPQPVQIQGPQREGAATVPGQVLVLQIYPPLPPPLPAGREDLASPIKGAHSPPASRTWLQTKKAGGDYSEGEEEKPKLFPLREVSTAPGVIGFVNVPINTGDVRAFKKEMGKLMDDPLGVADRLDEFLGTSIYSYEDIYVRY